MSSNSGRVAYDLNAMGCCAVGSIIDVIIMVFRLFVLLCHADKLALLCVSHCEGIYLICCWHL